jgi:G3E family GTPase
MLDPKPNIRNKSAIIFRDRAFNLQIKHNRYKIRNPFKFQHTPHKKNQFFSMIYKIKTMQIKSKQKKNKQRFKKKTQTIVDEKNNTLISLKGMRRLFSSLESNPRIREAR